MPMITAISCENKIGYLGGLVLSVCYILFSRGVTAVAKKLVKNHDRKDYKSILINFLNSYFPCGNRTS